MMKRTCIFTGLIMLLFVTMAVDASAPSFNLALNATGMTDFEGLTLADVADIKRSSPELLSKYGHILLKDYSRHDQIQPSQVLIALGKAGVDLSRVTLITGAEQIILPGASSDTLWLIRQQISKFIATRHKVDVSTIEVKFKRVPQVLPDRGDFDRIKVRAERPYFYVRFLAKSGKEILSERVEVEIYMEVPILIATRSLMPGQFVTAEDFHEEMKRTQSPKGYVSGFDQLGASRWRILQGLEAGEQLRRADLQAYTRIQKGDVVTLLTKHPRFQVRALGRVKEVLDDGSSVVVENVDTKKIIVGRPIGGKEVEVVY